MRPQYFAKIFLAMTVLHEWTHLWWIGPTNPFKRLDDGSWEPNPREVYGWYECAKLAAERSYDDQTYNNNAENYAWYAQYGYLFTRLGEDIWPLTGPRAKPVQAM